jgi:hypothetical protein
VTSPIWWAGKCRLLHFVGPVGMDVGCPAAAFGDVLGEGHQALHVIDGHFQPGEALVEGRVPFPPLGWYRGRPASHGFPGVLAAHQRRVAVLPECSDEAHHADIDLDKLSAWGTEFARGMHLWKRLGHLGPLR